MGTRSLFVRLGVLGAVLGAVLGFPGAIGVARAGNAVIVEPAFDEAIPSSDVAKLRAAPGKALREQSYGLISPEDVQSAISGEPQIKGCHTDLCYERLGRLLDGQIVLRYRVKLNAPAGKASGDWRLNVELLDVEVGAMGARLTEDCAGCGSDKAAAQLFDMVRRVILESAARPRNRLEIQSDPAGAAVFVDGTELGITPYKRTTFVGNHKVVLRHIGYRSEQIDTVVEESRGRPLSVKLSAGVDPVQVVVVEKEKTPVYKKWWFWVAIGGAVVAVSAITAGVVVATRSSEGTASERMVPANTLTFNF